MANGSDSNGPTKIPYRKLVNAIARVAYHT